MGEDEKSDKTAWTNCWPSQGLPGREDGGRGETELGHPVPRGAAGPRRPGRSAALGPRYGAGLRGKLRPAGAEGGGRGRCSCEPRGGAGRRAAGWGRRRRGRAAPAEGSAAEKAGARRGWPGRARPRGAAGASPLPAGGSPAAAAAAGRRGCGRPAWEGLSGGPSPGADGAAAAAAAIRRRGSRCPAWEGPCCIAAAALLPLRAHNGDSQPQQRLRRGRRERAGCGRPAGARRRQQHAG